MVFASEVGGLLEPRNASRRFATIAKRVTGTGHGPHVIRHSVASYLLVEQGKSPLEVTRVLRQSSPSVLEAYYSYLKPSRAREVGLLLGGLADS